MHDKGSFLYIAPEMKSSANNNFRPEVHGRDEKVVPKYLHHITAKFAHYLSRSIHFPFYFLPPLLYYPV